MRLSNRTALVTGGASGLGQAVAQAFAREGARVIIADINLAGAEATANAINAAGGTALALGCDVSQATQVEAMVRAAVERFGRLDIAYANAAIELIGKDAIAHELSEDIWDRTVAVNLKGMWLTCKYALAQMITQQAGSLIIAASPTGLFGLGQGETAYSTSKGGVAGLIRPLAADYARDGIRVNGIVPGFMDTPINALVLATPEMRAAAEATVPMGRLGRADDVAGLAVFLASDDSAFCTGGLYFADGGITAV